MSSKIKNAHHRTQHANLRPAILSYRSGFARIPFANERDNAWDRLPACHVAMLEMLCQED
jgi:hypothetical protein